MELLSGSLIYNVVKDIAKHRGVFIKTNQKRTVDKLEEHITWAEGWSRHIQMFGMTKAMPTEQKSITLSISDRPRKFYRTSKENDGKQIFSEIDILSSAANYIILGDPGCGKTTLCKRLTRNLILSEPKEPVECYEAPLVVLGRELHSDCQLSDYLAEIFGIEFEKFNERQNREELSVILDREKFNHELRERRNAWTKNVKGEAVSLLYKSLARGGFVLIIDGIDEIHHNYRVTFEHDLNSLVNNCPQLKLVATCRAGDWTRSILTADLLAIEPLNDDELREIVEAWADKPDDFMKAIQSVPYKEVLDRPLFLTLLLIIFNQGYKLPDCPVDVYERITTLLIERWDRERDLHRESKFASFLSEKKLRFLSSLAYHLTFEYSQKRFSINDLNSLYLTLAGRFKLPAGEFAQVLQEIESHTGILVESGFEHYEFCHLTVQEFLAAKHLVSLASNRNHLALLEESPATLAVATSVSSEPSKFLANLASEFCGVQERNLSRSVVEGVDSFITFVTRVEMELPEFSENNEIALCMIRLSIIAEKMEKLDPRRAHSVAQCWRSLCEFPAISRSVFNLFSRPGVIQTHNIAGRTMVKTMGKDFDVAESFVEELSRIAAKSNKL